MFLNYCCAECVAEDFQGPNNDTLYYLTLLNQTITCFEKYKEVLHDLDDIKSVFFKIFCSINRLLINLFALFLTG